MNWQSSPGVCRCSVFPAWKESTKRRTTTAASMENGSHQPPPFNNWSPHGRCCVECSGRNDVGVLRLENSQHPRRRRHPHRPSHRFAAFFLSASMSFSTYLLNGDRLAATHPSSPSRRSRHLGQQTTCFSTRRISASESSFKAWLSIITIDRWATAFTISHF